MRSFQLAFRLFVMLLAANIVFFIDRWVFVELPASKQSDGWEINLFVPALLLSFVCVWFIIWQSIPFAYRLRAYFDEKSQEIKTEDDKFAEAEARTAQTLREQLEADRARRIERNQVARQDGSAL